MAMHGKADFVNTASLALKLRVYTLHHRAIRTVYLPPQSRTWGRSYSNLPTALNLNKLPSIGHRCTSTLRRCSTQSKGQ